LKNVDGELENADGQDKERGENEGLKEAFAGNAFGPVAIFGGEFAAQDEPENEEAVKKAEDVDGKTDAAAVASFAIEIGRESVGGDFGLRMRLCGG
jgi:hypothetical protein